jgi:hypothetical protein
MSGTSRESREQAPIADAAHLNEILDEALRQTFPASDPVAISVEAPEPDERPSQQRSRGPGSG